MFRICRPLGIRILPETHDLFPQHVKDAWETFHNWWENNFDGENPVSKSSMPEEVSAAFQIMKDAPIPGFSFATGADSCYVIGVSNNLID